MKTDKVITNLEYASVTWPCGELQVCNLADQHTFPAAVSSLLPSMVELTDFLGSDVKDFRQCSVITHRSPSADADKLGGSLFCFSSLAESQSFQQNFSRMERQFQLASTASPIPDDSSFLLKTYLKGKTST